jgi:hypothetical protein
MNRFSAWLERGAVITDGAWGTELQKLGLPPGVVPDTWNLTQPEKVESVARAYAGAGSDVILTNTFRANAIATARFSPADLDAINPGRRGNFKASSLQVAGLCFDWSNRTHRICSSVDCRASALFSSAFNEYCKDHS